MIDENAFVYTHATQLMMFFCFLFLAIYYTNCILRYLYKLYYNSTDQKMHVYVIY